MAIVGASNMGENCLIVEVDHDPTSVTTDVCHGSLLINAAGDWFRKLDEGATTNVRLIPGIDNAGITDKQLVFSASGILSGSTNLTFDTAASTLTVTGPLVASTITATGLTTNNIVYVGASGLLSGNTGLTYDAANNALAVAGWANIGTVTDAGAQGDFAAGLTGAARLFYDQSAAKLTLTSSDLDLTGGYIDMVGAKWLRWDGLEVLGRSGNDVHFRTNHATGQFLFEAESPPSTYLALIPGATPQAQFGVVCNLTQGANISAGKILDFEGGTGKKKITASTNLYYDSVNTTGDHVFRAGSGFAWVMSVLNAGYVKIHSYLCVGTATDAVATGDFATGRTGANRLFYDQSTGGLRLYSGSLGLNAAPSGVAGEILATDGTYVFDLNYSEVGAQGLLQFGGPNPAGNTFAAKFFADDNAGDSANNVILSVGNRNASQGMLSIQFLNTLLAGGSQVGRLAFQPRNTADTTNLSVTVFGMTKNAATDEIITSISSSIGTVMLGLGNTGVRFGASGCQINYDKVSVNPQIWGRDMGAATGQLYLFDADDDAPWPFTLANLSGGKWTFYTRSSDGRLEFWDRDGGSTLVCTMEANGGFTVDTGDLAVSLGQIRVKEDGTNPGLQLSHGGSNLFATIEGPSNRTLRFSLRDNGASDLFDFRSVTFSGSVFSVGADAAVLAPGWVNVGSPSTAANTAGEAAFAGDVLVDGLLHARQGDAAGAVPAAQITQLDVDEPFLKLIGTAAAADLTRSIVDVGDVTTATVAGYVKIEVQDDGNQITDQDYFVPLYTLA